MSGTKRRGRPRKNQVPVFKDGSAPSGRGISSLGEDVRAGQREFFKEMRRGFSAGPFLTNDMISEVLKYEDGHPLEEGARIAAEEAIANAKSKARQQSSNAGDDRSRQNASTKSLIISDNLDLFGKVRDGKLSGNSAAILLRARLLRQGIQGWVPSVRKLNDWFSEYRSK